MNTKKDFSKMISEHSHELIKENHVIVTKTTSRHVKEKGVTYVVFTKDKNFVDTKPLLVKKKQAKKKKRTNIARDPFLPHEKPLEINPGLLENHVVIHNKFQVLTFQLLLITKEFKPQSGNLTKEDFQSIFRLCKTVMKNEIDDWVFFYNRGKKSGCSQPHKHIQIAKVTDENGKSRLPNHENLVKGTNLSLPFLQRYYRFETFEEMERDLEMKYNEFLKDLKIDESLSSEDSDVMRVRSGEKGEDIHEVDFNVDSYCLIFSSRYLLIVPRRNSGYENIISCNSLTFLHSFYISDPLNEKKVVEDITFEKIMETITYPL